MTDEYIYSLISVPFLNWYEGDWGHEYYLETYGSGMLSDFEGMLDILLWYGAAMAAAGIILLVLWRKFNPSDKIR